ncbi:unnamed protein product [Hermetia illucens]|uniref:General transcription factor 3C polypeptide 5 n=1 Tax=Hermetia illucens TaxID=343691 RepID=A0A7R8USY2_HERIL|nr:general transcription factor 3C polypeptide 5 [Hermetia illucens]CAD7086135.1 unnamed protein product [Hermetia illucens]
MESRVSLNDENLRKELRLVEYPGIVKNDDNMLATLGGIGRISQTFCEQVRRMELIFHPENRYCKPAYGDTHKIAGILIKVKVKKPRNGSVEAKEPPTHVVEILGHCKKSIKFTSMCDFQYLPIVRNPQTNHFEYIYDRIMPQGLPPVDWLKDPEQPLLLVPSVFARCDNMQTNTFRYDHSKAKDDGDVIGVVRSRPADLKTLCDFSLVDPIPTKGNPVVYKVMMAKLVNDQQFETVKKLFEECPIWNKVSLIYEANVSSDKLKCIIPAVCYHYRTGPWRTMYVRFGYDPRKHFEARYYQTFDYRIRFGAKLGAHIKTKRSTNNPRLCQRNAPQDRDEGLIQDMNYPYLEDGRLPRGRQSFYRYSDVRLPKVQEMLDKIPTPLSGATCNEKTGWLPPNFSDEVRAIVHSSVKQSIQAWRKESGLDGEGDYEDDFEEDEDIEDDEQDGDEDNDELDEEDFADDKMDTS